MKNKLVILFLSIIIGGGTIENVNAQEFKGKIIQEDNLKIISQSELKVDINSFKKIRKFDNKVLFQPSKFVDGSNLKEGKIIEIDNVLVEKVYYVQYSTKVPYYKDNTIFFAGSENEGYFVLNVKFKEGFNKEEIYSGVINIKGLNKNNQIVQLQVSGLDKSMRKETYNKFLEYYPSYLDNGEYDKKYENNKTYTFIVPEDGIKFKDIKKLFIYSSSGQKDEDSILVLDQKDIPTSEK